MTGDVVLARARIGLLRVLLLLAGLGCAVALRSVISGAGGPQSSTGGLVFAGCLLALSFAAQLPVPRQPAISVLSGAGGGLLLAGAALLRSGLSPSGSRGISGFLPWLVVAATVAVSEEAFLRGALFAVLQRLAGDTPAVIVGAVAFAALHVPLYGWQVLPLDFAVGLLLGTLRVITGSWASPAVAHVVADAAGWWLG